MPRSARTFVAVPPPAPEPMMTTSCTVWLDVTCAMCLLLPAVQRQQPPLVSERAESK